MRATYPHPEWKRCEAINAGAERQCLRNARVHLCAEKGTCLAHYCTQHARAGWKVSAPDLFDHEEVYSL